MNSLSTNPDKAKFSTKQAVMLALMAAVMMGGKLAMASLPNIEPVSLFIIVCTLLFGWKSLYSVAIYVMLEGLVFGFGTWWIYYLYTWPLLVVFTQLLRRTHSYLVLTAMSACFGLIFGALCSLSFLVIAGWGAAAAFWVAGIPYDLLHCAGNAVMAAVLLKPLHKLLSKLAGVSLWDN